MNADYYIKQLSLYIFQLISIVCAAASLKVISGNPQDPVGWQPVTDIRLPNSTKKGLLIVEGSSLIVNSMI